MQTVDYCLGDYNQRRRIVFTVCDSRRFCTVPTLGAEFHILASSVTEYKLLNFVCIHISSLDKADTQILLSSLFSTLKSIMHNSQSRERTHSEIVILCHWSSSYKLSEVKAGLSILHQGLIGVPTQLHARLKETC